MSRGGRAFRASAPVAGVAGLAAAIAAGAGCAAAGYDTKPRVAVVDGDPIVQMAPPGKLESLDRATLVPLAAHGDPPFRNETVIGLALAEPARMYPIGLLDDYEVVNDEAGGMPVVVVRCALADLSGVLDRRVAGRTLTFENSGAIWRDMLVLRDRETGTYWSPATGRALSGALEGETLRRLPAPVTTAEAWRELHPATVCLETGDLTAVPLQLRLYAASPMRGVSGEETGDRRFAPKETVFFVEHAGEALAFLASDLRKRRRAEAEVGGGLVILEWDAAVRAPRAWMPLLAARQEIPAVPIYWFALVRQFPVIRTLPPAA